MRARRVIPVRRTVPRRTTAKRRAFGNFASAMQQRDATNIIVNANEEVRLIVPANGQEATVVRNINSIMTTAPMFMNYATMYDQYKLNAVRVGIEMTYIGNDLLNSATFPSICTAWDRNGIKPRVVKVEETPGFLLPVYDTVSSYSSANEKTLYYGSRWGVVRQLDASSMMEKSVYLGTVNTKDVLSNDNLYNAWNPILLIALKSPRTVQVDSSVIFQIHYQFDVTLRGLRKVVISKAEDFKKEMQPNDNFMGYRKDNCGYAVPKVGGGYIAVPVSGKNAATSLATPTINPNLNEGGNANAGIYMDTTGKASDNLKI